MGVLQLWRRRVRHRFMPIMPRIHILSNRLHLNSVAFILMLAYGSHAAAQRLHGYVGSPYKPTFPRWYEPGSDPDSQWSPF